FAGKDSGDSHPFRGRIRFTTFWTHLLRIGLCPKGCEADAAPKRMAVAAVLSGEPEESIGTVCRGERHLFWIEWHKTRGERRRRLPARPEEIDVLAKTC